MSAFLNWHLLPKVRLKSFQTKMRTLLLIVSLVLSGCSLIHEGSHAIADPDNIKNFKPYPHMEGDSFLWGSVEFKQPVSQHNDILRVYSMPYLVDFAMYGASELILDTIEMPLWVRLTTIGVGQVMPMVDLGVNLYGTSGNTDFDKMDRTGVFSKSTAQAIGTTLLILGVANTAYKIYKALK